VHPGVSIVYSTYRRDPAFHWFVDGLARQLGDDTVEFVVVDGCPGPPREAEFAAAIAGRFELRYAVAKPSVFNGPHRRVPRPMHAASNARNTGIVAATQPYVVFVDDCSVPMPGWWAEVREGARHHYVVAGAYQKHFEMRVVDGILESSRADLAGLDARWETGDDRRVVPTFGSHLFGCSLGVPRQLLLDVDGYDELCDGLGGEDYQFGVRLELLGERLFYSRSMLTIESQELHAGTGQQLLRVDMSLDEPEYLRRLGEWGVTARSTDGRCDASHMMLDLVYGLRATESLGNHVRLADLTIDDLEATAATLPTTYWFNGIDLADMPTE
jgi:glycosyltransferase involved in cell wall biosynthesis